MSKTTSEWKSVKVGTLCARVTSGGTPSTKHEEYYGGQIPWLRTQEVDFKPITDTFVKITELGLANSSAKWIPANSVIVAMYGATAGRVAITKIPLTTNQACCNLIVDSTKADYRYLYYSLKLNSAELEGCAKGSAQTNLSAAIVKDFEIPGFPLPTQRRIADILSAYDDLIENNRRRIEILEETARTLYRKMFVVEAEPEWSIKPLLEVAEVLYGKDHKKLGDGSIPCYGSGGIMRFCNAAIYDKPSVLIPRKGSIGNVMFADEPFWSVDTMFYTRVKITDMERLLYYQLCDYNLASMSTGAAVPSMTTALLNPLEIVIPPDNLRAEYARIVLPICVSH